jgi:hypothetical protein
VYTLAADYEALLTQLQRGDEAAASATLSSILGCALSDLPQRPSARGLGTRALSYEGFKVGELAMLAAGSKRVVKFEDIPWPDARRFVRAMRGKYELLVTPPYIKDHLMLRSARDRPTKTDPRARVTVYASRDGSGARLRALEQANPADVRGPGRLLGFPDCCIEAFAADFERSRRDQDTLNDDAALRLLRTAGPTGRADARCNPLTDRELLGFYACRVDCPQAAAFADRTRAAIADHAPRALPGVEAALRRAVLFWRLPFFVVFDKAHPDGDGWLVFQRARVNVFGDSRAQQAQSFFARHIIGVLGERGRLRTTPGALQVETESGRTSTLRCEPGAEPALVWFE